MNVLKKVVDKREVRDTGNDLAENQQQCVTSLGKDRSNLSGKYKGFGRLSGKYKGPRLRDGTTLLEPIREQSNEESINTQSEDQENIKIGRDVHK